MVLTNIYIVKYQYRGQQGGTARHEGATMITTPELVALMQRERERHIEHDRLARIAACGRACCHPTRLDRLAHALRGTPAAC
jgi:hypothetical protein